MPDRWGLGAEQMTTDLTAWQERLEHHFVALRDTRAEVAFGQPVFALEHGLTEQDLNELFECLRSQIGESYPSREHFLAWIVYAAEFGYIYAGDEYWQTFEDNTPGWTRFGERNFIRECFVLFHREYNGARPTGVWANHFSIICWPIAHAILPRDMQMYLAEVLYNIRRIISEESLESPRRLGELIAAHGWRTSSRFQQLLQEPLLVGQIAAALLMEGDSESKALILPDTLARISGDLARERNSRAWLQGARQTARDRIAFQRGHGRTKGEPKTAPEGRRPAQSSRPARLEPRLVLRRASEREWQVFLELPDLSSLAGRFPKFVDILTNTRFYVTGSSGRRTPGERLLRARQYVQLRDWPKGDEAIIQLEKSCPELDHLLQSECLFSSRPIWVFKIASDGSANPLTSTSLRPGYRYLLVLDDRSDEIDLPIGEYLTLMDLQCAGARAADLALPDPVDEDLATFLTSLGLGHATTTHVWPAGLTPSRWDGEGRAEWLATDSPCIALRSDHTVKAFRLALQNETLEVAPAAPGATVFVEFSELDAGTHDVTISEVRSNSASPEMTRNLEIHIREPRSHLPGVAVEGAFLVALDPPQPTLEEFWQGETDLEILGPRGRRASILIQFFRKSNSQPILRKQLPDIGLPVSADRWRKHVFEYFQQKKDVQNAYDIASSCNVRIGAGNLGVFSFRVEREFVPLRWVVRRTSNQYLLELLDDRGSVLPPKIALYDFATPDVGHNLDVGNFTHPTETPVPPGMYVAQTEELSRAVLIPPVVHSFGDLRVEPHLASHGRRPQDIVRIIRTLELWRTARTTGDVFMLKVRGDVLSAFIHEVFRLIAGERWGRFELEKRRTDTDTLHRAAHACLKNPGEGHILDAMFSQLNKLSLSNCHDRAGTLAVLAGRFLQLPCPVFKDGSDIDSSLPEASRYALCLASCSGPLAEEAGADLEEIVSYLLCVPGLARAARLMVLLLASRQPGPPLDLQLYEDWEW